MTKKSVSLLLSIMLIFSGCGTICHGGSQNLMIKSDPPGAKATLSNGYEITTPETVSLKRSEEQVITFQMDGYKKKQVMVTRSFNGVATILGNLPWLIVGVIVDFVAGGAWTLKPEAVNATMEKA